MSPRAVICVTVRSRCGVLGLRGAGSDIVGIDLRGRGGAQGPAAVGHRVVDVAVDEVVDVGVVQGVADERVGDAVLHGAQVHMRQRRLGHRGDDARHPRQLVGQRLIDHHITRMGSLLQRHHPQEAVSLRLVERDVVHIGEDVLLQQHIDAGTIIESPFFHIERQRARRHRVIRQVVVKQRHAGRQHLIRIGHSLERVGILRLELEAVHAQRTVGSNHIGVVHDLALHRPLQPGWVSPKTDDIREIGVCPVCLGVHEIDNRAVGVHAEQIELDELQVSQMCIDEDARALVGQRLKCLAVGNGHRAVNGPDSRRGVQRVHPPQFSELGDVVDAVAVDVARIRDEIFVHPVALCGESRELLGQRGRAGLPQSH